MTEPGGGQARGAIRIGISGWRYEGWRGEFYPDGLPQRAEMEYACSRFPTVELNGSFYSLIEIRNESFLVPGFIELLRERGMALVVSHSPGVYPMVEEPTADFMYLRLHGAERMYYGS